MRSIAALEGALWVAIVFGFCKPLLFWYRGHAKVLDKVIERDDPLFVPVLRQIFLWNYASILVFGLMLIFIHNQKIRYADQPVAMQSVGSGRGAESQ
jgi:hypothetical protein